ncbi:16S rRNA (uracil(1498)-N(3))-methyltransferase [Bacteroidota bacterium]
MHIFYSPEISSGIYSFNEQESRHCIKVLRLSKGSKISLIDGLGGYYKAEIVEAHLKKCSVKILESMKGFEKRNYYSHIGIAPTKNIDRFELFLEKATEIGIDEITPLLCEHSERKKIRIDRLEKIIISAIKQSVKAYKPILNEMISFDDFISLDNKGQKFIAHCENVPKSSLKMNYTPAGISHIMIGPEGDFSNSEIELAINSGYTGISLGSSRLRTETAGIVAAHTISLINE